MPPARQQLLFFGLIGASVVTGLATLLARVAGPAGAFAPLVSALVYIAVLAVALAGIDRHHLFPRLGTANLVTLLRTILVSVLAGWLVVRDPGPIALVATVLATIAACLDAWDGPLARRSGMASAFGARFDMEVDALFILVLSALAWRWDKAGAWVLLSGALRYLFVAASWGLPWLNAPLGPSLRRKTICVVQIVGLIVAIAPVITRPLSEMAAGLTLVLLAWSFVVDVAWLARARAASA